MRFDVGDVIRAASGKTAKVTSIERDSYVVEWTMDDVIGDFGEDKRCISSVPFETAEAGPYAFELIKRGKL